MSWTQGQGLFREWGRGRKSVLSHTSKENKSKDKPGNQGVKRKREFDILASYEAYLTGVIVFFIHLECFSPKYFPVPA